MRASSKWLMFCPDTFPSSWSFTSAMSIILVFPRVPFFIYSFPATSLDIGNIRRNMSRSGVWFIMSSNTFLDAWCKCSSSLVSAYKNNPKHDHHLLFYLSLPNLKYLEIILNKITYSVLGCLKFLNIKKRWEM